MIMLGLKLFFNSLVFAKFLMPSLFPASGLLYIRPGFGVVSEEHSLQARHGVRKPRPVGNKFHFRHRGLVYEP